MICYKGFNKDMTCTKGSETFQYEVGKTYEEEKAKTVSCGFHCVEEPIEVLTWYPNGVWCLVEAEGDLSESDQKIACTKMTIKKKLTKAQMVMVELAWLESHPDRECSRHVNVETGTSQYGICVVKGRNPRAKGAAGDVLGLLKVSKKGYTQEVGLFVVGEDGIEPGKWYNVRGEEVSER